MLNIHVLVPSFNCHYWIKRCLLSIDAQTHAPAQVLVIDDASTDPAYGPECEHWCKATNTLMRYHRNETNLKCPHNLRVGIDMLDPAEDDVIFLLDGDDFLPDDGVFARIADVYRDPDVWLTYGSYVGAPMATELPEVREYQPPIIWTRAFRQQSNYFNHPLTFRRFLWDGVTDADLQDHEGEWFTSCYDQLIMLPMLEMAGGKHYRFLPDVLYAYNTANPLSEYLVHDDQRPAQVYGRPKKELLVR